MRSSFSDRSRNLFGRKKDGRIFCISFREFVDFYPEQGNQYFVALQYLTNAIRNGVICFLISDFMDDHDFEQPADYCQ